MAGGASGGEDRSGCQRRIDGQREQEEGEANNGSERVMKEQTHGQGEYIPPYRIAATGHMAKGKMIYNCRPIFCEKNICILRIYDFYSYLIIFRIRYLLMTIFLVLRL
jgi:hypothetical protein